MEPAQLKLALQQKHIIVDDLAFSSLIDFTQLVLKQNQVMNLTAHRDQATLLEKGILDSLLFPFEFSKRAQVLDLGSGGGFPGIPLKIVYPDITMTLLEPIQKKAHFLEQVIQTLKLKDCEVQSVRAEDYVRQHREVFDVVTARAVGKLNMLIELALPLLKVHGKLYAYKGPDYLSEIAEAKHALQALHAEISEVKRDSLSSQIDQRILLVITKHASSPTQYPRMFSQIKKTPL
jgi:16S rRNA (guanine527-N7)-methyltransferase